MAIVKWGFRRFYSTRQALSEMSKLVAGSNAQQSSAVTPKKQVRGKAALAARKNMLQSYVNKYRAMNQGKFPSPSSAQKEIGGGYYSLKKMLQEMEYNDKSYVEKESVMEHKSVDQKFEDCVLEFVSNLDTNVDSKEGLQPSTSNADTGNINVTRDDTLDIVTVCHDKQGHYDEKLEQNLKDEPLLGDNFAFKLEQNLKDESLLGEAGAEFTSDMPGPQKEVSKAESQHEIQTIKSDVPEQQKDEDLKAEQNHEKIQNYILEQQKIEVLEAETHHYNQQKDESKPEKQSDETQSTASDLPKQQTDEEIREKLSLWGNLKMLATGLINIWKK